MGSLQAGQGRIQDQALKFSLNAHRLPVLEKCLHIPRNDPMEQSDCTILSSRQCSAMVPDGKDHNLVFNPIKTATLTRDCGSLLEIPFAQFPFSPATKEAHWRILGFAA